MTEETRVRIGGKQKADGNVQLDFTVEAPTVEKAGELLGPALKTLKAKIQEEGLEIVRTS